MKLNNHGWGYRDMIIYGCIILLFLLIAAYNINYLYSGLTNDTNNKSNSTNNLQQSVVEEQPTNTKPQEVIDYNYYYSVEEKIKNATLNYLNDYRYDLTNQILKTSTDTLVSFGYMSTIYDQTGTYECVGYSNAYSNESTGQYEIKPYVSCNNYITEGY